MSHKCNSKKCGKEECKCNKLCTCDIKKPKAFDQMESYSIDTMLKINQQLIQLMEQDGNQQFMIKMLREKVKEVKSGKLKGPFFIQMGRNIFVPETDTKKFLKNMSEQLNLLRNQNKTVSDQLGNIRRNFDQAVVAVSKQLSKRAEGITLPETPKPILDKPVDKLTEADKALIQKTMKHNSGVQK